MAPVFQIVRDYKDWDKFAKSSGEVQFPPWSVVCDLMRQRGSVCCLIESHYIDIDFRSEFATFHTRKFDPGPSFYTTAPFFAQELYEETADLPGGLEANQEHYLGYCVLRPVEQQAVGRTLLSAPNFGGKGYLTCYATFAARIGGDVLTVEAMPFIQQDGMVMRCAQACLWMAARYYHQKYEFPRWLPSDINHAATHGMGQTLPSTGLTVEQVARALHGYGLGPIVYREVTVSALASGISCYVDSGIPVFCSIKTGASRHAALIVGYLRDPNYRTTNKRDPAAVGPRSFLNNISHFIVHDDSSGPYRLLPLIPAVSMRPQGQEERRDGFTGRNVGYSFDEIESFIIPLPWKVHMNSESAIRAFQDMLPLLIETMQDDGEKVKFQHKFDTGNLSYRARIVESELYKRWLATHDTKGPTVTAALYRYLDMPRFIWLIEIIDDSQPSTGCVVGEVIFDPTQRGFDRPWLAVHLPSEVATKWVAESGVITRTTVPLSAIAQYPDGLNS